MKCACVGENESVCVKECVWEREREWVWERKRECVRERVCVRESDRVCAHVLVTHHGSPRNAAFKTGAWIAVQAELCAVQLQLELLYSLDFVLYNFRLSCCTGWTLCCTTSAWVAVQAELCAVQLPLELLYRLNFVLYNFRLSCCAVWTLYALQPGQAVS